MTVGPVPDAPAATPAPRPPEPVRTPEPVRAPTPGPGPEPARPPEGEATPETGVDAVATFALTIGTNLITVPLEGAGVTVTRNQVVVDVSRYGVALPGLTLTRLTLRLGANHLPTSGTLAGDISAPFVHGSATLTVDANGNVTGDGHGTIEVEVLGRPVVTFAYEAGQWSGSATVEARDLARKLPIPNVIVDEGRVTVSVAGDRITGNMTARFHHAALGNGNVTVNLTNTGVDGSGGFDLTMPLLAGSHGDFSFADGKLAANLALQANNVHVPIPGLTLSTLTGNLALADGAVSGVFGLTASYTNLATLTLSDVAISGRGFAGARGAIDVTAPPIQGSHGSFVLDAHGRPSGTLTIASDRIPIPALRRGSITITLRPDGGVDVSGTGRIELGPVGGGDFTVSWVEGVLRIGADATINVPPLHPVVVRVDYQEGQLVGELTTGVTIGPLSGDVLLRFRDNVFSGEGRLAYALGRFNGWVLVRVDPAGLISGEGEATFRLSDWLQGTIGLIVHPDLNVDAHGELVVPQDITLFEPWRFERNFFHFEQDFPLWGITIPVVGSIGLIASVHASAGFRASFGPGTLRNIRATGDVSTRPDAEPAFTISGDFNIPAGAEIVIVVGGGIGLAALIAKIEGGIDLNGIAGIYGAITLTPTFAYENGQYTLRGEALLQAAAQLRASISAYARVVAGIGWLSGEVWRKDWNLAEWRFDTGWHVGLKAGIQYVLGQPFEPHIDFEPVDVDPQALIKAAVPNSGQPVPAPPSPPAPAAEFHAQAGEAGATVSPQPGGGPPAPGGGGGAAPPGAGGSAPPAPGTAPAPGAAPTPTPGTAAAPGAPAAPAAGAGPPIVDPPAAETEDPNERTIDETYLVYVYDNLAEFFSRAGRATAPADDELRESAEAKGARLPAPLGPKSESGPGKPLSPQTRSDMETVFDTDLSRVRVHADEAAGEGARMIGAEAYAVGSDVFFGQSRSPDADKKLLAHELVHVVQHAGPTKEKRDASTREAEAEAEEAAEKVRKGEKPKPVRKRRKKTGIHRAEKSVPPSAPAAPAAGAPGAGPAAGTGPHILFTESEWKRLLEDPETLKNPQISAKIKKLLAKGDITAKAKKAVWRTADKDFVDRSFVRMRFPGADYLPHKAATSSDLQISEGMELTRTTEERDDAAQSELSDLMYPPTSEEEGGEEEELDPEFSTTPMSPMSRYLKYQTKRGLKPEHDDPEPVPKGQKTSGSQYNLSLTEKGFRAMFPEWTFGGGKWTRRKKPLPPGASPDTVETGGGADASVDRITRNVLVKDYQAHHVIPLWLRSTARPSGDTLQNLAPWHRDAHQTNHAFHHNVPQEIRDTTGATDYRQFPDKTRFILYKAEGGNQKYPVEPPAVKLAADKTWQPSGGRAIWLS